MSKRSPRLPRESRDFDACMRAIIAVDSIHPLMRRPDNETVWTVQPRATLASVILATIERLGMTKTQFAQHMRVYQSQVSHWLSGSAQGMSMERRATLRNLLRRYPDLDRMYALIDWPADQRKRQR